MQDLLLISPILVVFLGSLCPVTLKVFYNKELSPYFNVGLVVCSLIMAVGLMVYFGFALPEEGYSLFSSSLRLNALNLKASLFLLLIGTLVAFIIPFYPQIHRNQFSETLFLLQNALVGLLIMVWSQDLLTAFVGFELASLAFYLLIALGHSVSGRLPLSVAFKYFILGSLASAILLYGMALVFGAVGNFNIQYALSNFNLVESSRILVLGFVLVLVGFLFKVSIFPFQFWLPEVYRGASTPLLVVMTTGFKVGVFTLLLQWTQNIYVHGNLEFLFNILQWLAVLSMLFGNIIALYQKDLRLMLLFSTVAHSGYMLMILISHQMGDMQGFSSQQEITDFLVFWKGEGPEQALLYYLFVYILMTIGVFVSLKPFEEKHSMEVPVNKLAGVGKHYPLRAFLITLFLLSLAGIPPTGGFIAKFLVLQTLLQHGHLWMVFWTILGSTIALFYYLRPIASMYLEPAPEVETDEERAKKAKKKSPRWNINPPPLYGPEF